MPLRSETGAALIALMLVLVLGSGLMSIGWLEAAARSAHRGLRTESALAAARDALIGYAASYPDQHDDRHGPGYLPCPDRTGNGSPNTPCPARSLGWLPWRRLGLHDPRDGAGERLWYGLDRRFRAIGHKFRPLNADTAADLVANGQDDVAAVLLAPGEPLSVQNRERGRFDPAQYLESGNQTPDDGAYFSRDIAHDATIPQHSRLNDRTVAISRDELMTAAAGRVLAATRTILERYRDAPWNAGAFPWLAPWSAPSEGALPVPGVTAGRLPLVLAGSRFETSFRVTGSLTGGRVVVSGSVDAGDLDPLSGAFPVPQGQCMGTAPTRLDCTGESRRVQRPGRVRVYRFDLHLAGEAAVTPPARTDIRRRSVQGSEWVAPSRIEVVDLEGGIATGRGRLELGPGPMAGTLAVKGVGYPLVVGDEVPEWLVANDWHLSLMVAVAPAFAGGGEMACGAPARCLSVVRTSLDGRTDETAATAVVLFAGRELPHQRRTAPNPSQWFEGENANPANFRYETKAVNESFNDRTAFVAALPGLFAP